ncbi:hypothetical protein [Dictyobacter formicarum]|uniref:TIR domain-containing protein n=1 Tax=Dictyobacter formicarum TaxID=2778368 RepID=A0ABQ3VJT6_9CHLR|nr:hypothetical protein [Dictyobacter formicarum]GHO85926.1 hypothetical protein KSZ_39320 [Dictyobacter formicarum]
MLETRDQNIKIRVLYVTEDIFWLNVFKVHLKELAQQGLIAGWECCDISVSPADSHGEGSYAGDDALVCVLISQHFFASEFSDGLEMEQILERHEDGDIVLVPVLLHGVDWRQNSFVLLHTLGLQAPYAIHWSDAQHDFVGLPEAIQSAIELYHTHTPVATTAPDFSTSQQMVRKLLLANCLLELTEGARTDRIQKDTPGKAHPGTIQA